MCDLETMMGKYLDYCKNVKRLDVKTLKAYRCDLLQFVEWMKAGELSFGTEAILAYVAHLNAGFAASTTKRKLAALRAFSSHLYAGDRINDPFNYLELKIREPKRLPRTIPLEDLCLIVRKPFDSPEACNTYTRVRNKAIVELLLATGMRISELCALDEADFDWGRRNLLIMGKGAKERVVQIESESTLDALSLYFKHLHRWRIEVGRELVDNKAMFVNRFGVRLSEQAARSAVARYATDAGSAKHVTPHMFRHTFATMLLEDGVDIRYIQALLGHSSVKTTERYTHVSSNKLRQIMKTNNPRDSVERYGVS